VVIFSPFSYRLSDLAPIPLPTIGKSRRERQWPRSPTSNNPPNPHPEIPTESLARAIARAAGQAKADSTRRTKIQRRRDYPGHAKYIFRAALSRPKLSNRPNPKQRRRSPAIRFVPGRRGVLTQWDQSQWEHSRTYKEEERGPIAAHPNRGAPRRRTSAFRPRWKLGVQSRCDRWLPRRRKAVSSRRERLKTAGFGRWHGPGLSCYVLFQLAGQRSIRGLNLPPAGYSSESKSQNGKRREAGRCKTQSGASLPCKLARASRLRTSSPFYVRS
jgi:hypothetical protein